MLLSLAKKLSVKLSLLLATLTIVKSYCIHIIGLFKMQLVNLMRWSDSEEL